MTDYQKLYYNHDDFLAYRQHCAKSSNKLGLIFLGGTKSNMNGTKARAVAKYAQEHDYNLIRFDYFGHGQSSGEFQNGTIGLWLENSLAIIDQLTENQPQILIGSSMGGWIMLLAALARPHKIAGLIGLASAPDFTEDLIYNHMSARQKEQLALGKQVLFPDESHDNAHLISHNLIIEGRQHLLLNKSINISAPIILIHGMKDEDVPYETSIRIAKQVISQDVKTMLIKNADHRLSAPEEIEVIYRAIEAISNNPTSTK